MRLILSQYKFKNCSQNVNIYNFGAKIMIYCLFYSISKRYNSTLAVIINYVLFRIRLLKTELNISISRLEIPSLVANTRQFLTTSITSEIISSATLRLNIYSSQVSSRIFKSALLVEELISKLWYSLNVGFMS